ncbi:hypothetical protein PP182_01375 [Maribacter sp. PR1]|uniref:Secreted protein n=1 Tax=Maribacter cobaltidurans TaxID=1178778 RepID=A0ABU7IP75_9FLAO|nr:MULTISPECIES: hypothetical protein [Maribacter]MDC6387315.1 hypothetical protein [Maribacter sp. PR1]MEE1974700.1 hypothetical protein [Maribacter cobaltidurans]
MRAIYIVVYFLFISGALAQVAGFGKSSGVTTDAQLGISYNEVDVQGSPYVNELYKKGTTVVYGKKAREALMRYNAYTDAIEIIDENGKARSILRQRNIVATFGGKSYVVMGYLDEGKSKLGYFNPLNEGHVELLWKPKKIFVQAENPDHGYDTFSPPTFKDVSRYYIRKEGKPAETFRLSKRSLLKYLDEESKNLKEYIRINNLNLKEEKDVIILIEYYNSLLSNQKSNEIES